MGYFLNPWALGGIIVLVFAWAMSAFVYFARPSGLQNRLVALMLALEGAGMGCGVGLMWLTDDYAASFGWQMVGFTTFAASMPVYMLFLGTLDAPLARPLKLRLVRRALAACAVIAPVIVMLSPRTWVPALMPVWWAPWELSAGPWTVLFMQAIGALSIFGLAAVISAYRAARGPAAKARAKALVVAFGTRDALWTLLWFLFPVYQVSLGVAGSLVLLVVMPLVELTFVALMAYGILRAQLFDIDLKVKWTVKQSTVAALFVGVFFVVSESASTFLSGSGLGPYLGIAAAGLLVFAMAPLQRAADRVANAALPNADASRQYLEFRKLQVYQAALEGAYDDGLVTGKERTVLERLRAELAIAPEAAAAVEADLRRARAAHGAT